MLQCAQAEIRVLIAHCIRHDPHACTGATLNEGRVNSKQCHAHISPTRAEELQKCLIRLEI
jgi:hypothetical protein